MATPTPPRIANGSCRKCFEPCVRYGVGGNPLWDSCLQKQMQLWGEGVKLAGRGRVASVEGPGQ